MTRTLRLFVAATAVALALFGVFASCAYATLEDTPTPVLAASSSNPGFGADAWWREGWGNTLYPDFSLNPPGAWSENTDGYLVGSLYLIDRVGNTIINTSTPNLYYRDTFPTGVTPVGGTNTAKTLDMLGVYMNPPTGSWPAMPAGATNPLEGKWYYHYLFMSSWRIQNGTPNPPSSVDTIGPYPWTFGFGIDLTPPGPVSGLRIRTGIGTTSSDVTTWTPATRAVVSWNASETDSLSGTGYYQLLLDDQPYVPDGTSAPAQGRIYNMPWSDIPSQITVENVPPGAHKLSIEAVDRATNVGPATSIWFYSDPDTPTISWANPSGSVIDPRTSMLSVNASDLAGDPSVTISLGTTATPNMFTSTIATAPYVFTPNLSSLATGTYTLRATVKDHLNRTVTISKSVFWNPYGTAGSTGDNSMDVSGTVVVAPGSAETSTGGTDGGWTNTLSPPITLVTTPGATDLFYAISRPAVDLDTNNLQNYLHSVTNGLPFSGVVNLKDTADLGGWPSGGAGAIAPYEGPWYYQWVWYSAANLKASSHSYRVKYNVDLTPPTAVTGFATTPTAGVWTAKRRATLSWDVKQYDALSGNAYYAIWLDGSIVATQSASDPMAGKATIETMPIGKHTLSINVFDKAGNSGPLSNLDYQCDPDTPTISWILPSDPAMNQGNRVFSVDAADQAGTPTVVFSLDHNASYAATLTAPPYEWTPDLSALALGAHTVYATVTDPMGRSVTTSMAVTWSTPLVPSTIADLKTGDPSPVSASNPSLLTDGDTWWRQGWGRSLTPDVTFSIPTITDDQKKLYGMIIGGLYSISTSPQDINPATPQAYYRMARGSGTNLNQTIDLQGVFNYPPIGGWRTSLLSGATTAIEGPWYMNMRYLTSAGLCSSVTYHVPMGIDITPPSAVESMVVSPSMNTADATGSITTSRVNISWKPKEYDALSGDAYYQIYIDGQPTVPDGDSNPAQGRVFNLPGTRASSVAIENFPPGLHTVGVAAVDRATNVGPVVTTSLWSDPDTPTIAWRNPSGGVLDPRTPVVSVNASDLAGDPLVTLSIGTTATPQMYTSTIATPEYTWSPDLSALATGTYTLTASVRDHAGRTVTIKKFAYWAPHAIAGSSGAGIDPSVDVTGVAGYSIDSADTSTGASTGWTNNLDPLATLAAPSGASDMFYNIVQTPAPIDTYNLQNYYRSANPGGTLLSKNINLKDTIDSGGPWASGPSGAVAPYEGSWYFQWVWYNQNSLGASAQTYRLRFNVDRTPPTQVSGFSITPAAGTWTSSSRATLKWTARQYDALSGDRAFLISLDDALAVTVSATSALPGQATIENMPAGKHKVSIAAVDYAGNVGPSSDLYFMSDPDTPTISWTLPTDTALNISNHTFAVDAQDSTTPTVVFKLDNGASYAATVTSAPYSVSPDLNSLTPGAHLLSATVYDGLGRSVTTTKAVTWGAYDGSLDTTGVAGSSTSWVNGTWVNTLFPIANLNVPANGNPTGIVYNIVQTPSTVTTAGAFYHAVKADGTHYDNIVDLRDTIDAGAGTWLAGPLGSVAPYEGTWYFQWRWYGGTYPSSFESSNTYRVAFKVDMTPPGQVQNFSANPTPGVWTSSQRLHLTWTDQEYDTLSKTNHYRILVDGGNEIDVNRTDPVPNALTIENMPAGKHAVTIAAVDNAGNVGPESSLFFEMDSDVPTISFVEPTSTITPAAHTISVNASDAAGNPSVTFAIQGGPFATKTTLGTVNAPPYSITPDLASMGITDGTYTLYATATDFIGHTVTVTKTVVWDSSTTLVSNPSVDLADGASVGVSSTNPSLSTDPDAWWRQGWGNSLTPDFVLNPPTPDPATAGLVVGMLYSVTTDKGSINPSTPDLYYRAARGGGTNLDKTIDLQGVYNYPPVGGWRGGTPATGASSLLEGPWYLNLRWFTSRGYSSSRTYSIPMGIDLTPPSQVESLVVSPSLDSADATSVIATNRVHISWKAKSYDSLSGVAYYQIYIDGSPTVPDSANNPAQGRVYNIPGASPNSVTIEGLSVGQHTIGVAAVDRATNVGKPAETVIWSDTDTPTIAFTRPTGTTIGVKPTLEASATDKGGVSSVVFKLDGVTVGTGTKGTGNLYSASVDLSAFDGGAHTLTATVTDMFGRQVTATKYVNLDKVPLTLTNVTTSGSGRTVKVTYTLSRAATVRMALTIAATSVTVVNPSAGTYSVTYTYPKGRSYPSATSFKDTFALSATDSLGNVVTTTGKVTVTLAKIVKLSGNKIKIIYY